MKHLMHCRAPPCIPSSLLLYFRLSISPIHVGSCICSRSDRIHPCGTLYIPLSCISSLLSCFYVVRGIHVQICTYCCRGSSRTRKISCRVIIFPFGGFSCRGRVEGSLRLRWRVRFRRRAGVERVRY